MFVRFVQLRIKSDELPGLRERYESRIIPVLQDTDGCLFAGILQNTHYPEHCISLTLWTSRQKADAYEQSGNFGRLLDMSRPFFADSSEFQIHLDDDLTLSYLPVPENPVVQAFNVTTPETPAPHTSTPFIRIVTHQVNPDRKREFAEMYNAHILPELRRVEGCQQVYLIEDVADPEKFLSLTVWERREHSLRYEQSGLFESLLEKLRPMFSGVYQWKVQLQRETGGQVVSTDDIAVDGYTVLVSRSFPAHQGRRPAP
jgi:quinol monooxygenase YgiN